MKQLSFFDQNKDTWIKLARQEALRIARERGEVCADDIHRSVPIPAYIDRRIMGSAFDGLKFKHYKKSERKECHHRVIAVFTI